MPKYRVSYIRQPDGLPAEADHTADGLKIDEYGLFLTLNHKRGLVAVYRNWEWVTVEPDDDDPEASSGKDAVRTEITINGVRQNGYISESALRRVVAREIDRNNADLIAAIDAETATGRTVRKWTKNVADSANDPPLGMFPPRKDSA